MKNKKATFEHSVDVLVKAYLNDTLVHGNCYACAVGNLVCNAMNLSFIRKEGDLFPIQWAGDYPYPGIMTKTNNIGGWGAVFSSDFEENFDENEETSRELLVQKFDLNKYTGEARKQIDSTGYTPEQLAMIEYAFESMRRTNDAQYNGLIAVVDVLAEIHCVDLSVKEQAVGRFAEIHATKV